MLSPDVVEALNVALNESDLLGIEVEPGSRAAIATFRVLTLTPEGDEPSDRIVRFTFHEVSRVAASLRAGPWDDPAALVERIALEHLATEVRSFGGLPIYGWEFIDPGEQSWRDWRDRLSLDEVFADTPSGHVIELFQAGGRPERHLDLRVWFNGLSISTSTQVDIEPAHFAAGGVRWWDAMYAGNPATQGHGIVAMGPGPQGPAPSTKSSGWRRFIAARRR